MSRCTPSNRCPAVPGPREARPATAEDAGRETQPAAARLGGHESRRAPIWLAALAALALPAVVPAVIAGEREARALERRLAFERASIAPLVAHSEPPRSLLFSDLPDFAAWTANRPVVWLTRQEFGWLPAPGDSNPLGLPVRDESVATWFHVAPGDTARGGK